MLSLVLFVRDIMEEEKQNLKQGYNVIMDIPLLFENELENTVDEVSGCIHF